MADSDQDVLAQKLTQYHEKGVTKVKLGLTDVDGVMRGKYVGLDKFAGLMEKGGGFCDCLFGWDVDDQLYDESRYTGWHTGFPDAHFRLVAATERWLPDENCPFFVGEFVASDGGDHPICPRSLLTRIVARLSDRGLIVRSGFEYEFFVFQEDPHSVRDKGYQDLRPLTPGNFGYSVLRSSVESDLFAGLMDYAGAFECALEGLHCETGPGVWEAALKARIGVDAADRANLFKTFSKVFLQREGLIGTFMAKWSMDYPGQSGHFHFSFEDEQHTNLFHEPNADSGMSSLQRHAVGGLQRYLPEWIAMLAPTTNSYTRLVKGAWAPTAATWGIENRTAGIRVIPGGERSQRIECRIGGADGNPYLVASAVLGAALQGIEESLEPTAAVSGNAYEIQDSLPADLQFSPNLRMAAERLGKSTKANDVFGMEFVDHFVTSRLWEAREYERHVNSWQLERYFEII
ncbi:MAG: glutamine synthetase [Pseudomonadales bacterium]|nr:glutamine synthetase [Pseudomonadales bacterium]